MLSGSVSSQMIHSGRETYQLSDITYIPKNAAGISPVSFHIVVPAQHPEDGAGFFLPFAEELRTAIPCCFQDTVHG